MSTTSLADAAVLLSAWEEAAAVPDGAVAATLLHRAGLVASVDEGLDLPLGHAAARLARLYADSFGNAVDAVLTCPGCQEHLEVSLPLAPLCRAPDGPDQQIVSEETVPGKAGPPRDYVVRSPTGRDLLLAATEPDPAAVLLSRCVVADDGAAVDPATLDAGSLEALDAAAERLAGGAAPVLRSQCPACSEAVLADVDLAALLWQRVCREAPVVLADVAELSAAFGWSEAEVLAMSRTRREAYLSLARGAT
ncbi:MAG TPA: hypothetical protein VMK84_07280 [Streptosporangiaceae bacterium]|nr:hypothetical protein [Streptosporangiaceae bacterium]